jgi:hypothetical protein
MSSSADLSLKSLLSSLDCPLINDNDGEDDIKDMMAAEDNRKERKNGNLI